VEQQQAGLARLAQQGQERRAINNRHLAVDQRRAAHMEMRILQEQAALGERRAGLDHLQDHFVAIH
jgi:hypothetical protein